MGTPESKLINHTPELEVGSTSIILSVPSEFPNNTEIVVEIWKSDDYTTRASYTISLNRPSLQIRVEKGRGYLYKYQTIQNDEETPWSKPEPFTSGKEPTCIESLYSAAPSLDEIKLAERTILIVGTVGCGKSSFINTLSKAVSGINKDQARIFYTARFTTNKVSPYELKDTKITLIDTPGLEKGDDFRMNTVLELINGDTRDSSIPRPDVIVFLHAFKDAMGSEASDYRRENKSVFEALNRSRIPCMAILTHMDRITSDGEDVLTTANYLDHPRVINFCQKFRSNSGIPYVYPFINYTNFDANDVNTNRIALRILDLLINC